MTAFDKDIAAIHKSFDELIKRNETLAKGLLAIAEKPDVSVQDLKILAIRTLADSFEPEGGSNVHRDNN
jgi:low affinity Fe/Cu permease